MRTADDVVIYLENKVRTLYKSIHAIEKVIEKEGKTPFFEMELEKEKWLRRNLIDYIDYIDYLIMLNKDKKKEKELENDRNNKSNSKV